MYIVFGANLIGYLFHEMWDLMDVTNLILTHVQDDYEFGQLNLLVLSGQCRYDAQQWIMGIFLANLWLSTFHELHQLWLDLAIFDHLKVLLPAVWCSSKKKKTINCSLSECCENKCNSYFASFNVLFANSAISSTIAGSYQIGYTATFKECWKFRATVKCVDELDHFH